jgi:hypothetical protein
VAAPTAITPFQPLAFTDFDPPVLQQPEDLRLSLPSDANVNVDHLDLSDNDGGGDLTTTGRPYQAEPSSDDPEDDLWPQYSNCTPFR